MESYLFPLLELTVHSYLWTIFRWNLSQLIQLHVPLGFNGCLHSVNLHAYHFDDKNVKFVFMSKTMLFYYVFSVVSTCSIYWFYALYMSICYQKQKIRLWLTMALFNSSWRIWGRIDFFGRYKLTLSLHV